MARQTRLIAQCARLIYDGFTKYNENFSRITHRARQRFENRNWAGHQADLIERIDLYEKSVVRIVSTLKKDLGPRVNEHTLWNDIRWYYGERLKNVPDAGFMKTFFNSISRRIFRTIGIDPHVEFVSPAPDEGYAALEALTLKRYPYWGTLEDIFLTILNDFVFKIPYKDIHADSRYISQEIEEYARAHLDEYGDLLRFDFIDSFFYQSARSYLVGRLIQQHQTTPIVLALMNTDDGIEVDAVLMSEEEVSNLFSYTRSYYFADPLSVIGTVHFLHSILPGKPIDELYTVLGRLRQGKTERYRIFTQHLNNTNDKFVHAVGDTGLVMLVFTLPSYNLVFKIIRDKFGFPKTIGREDVLEKYKLVSKHDRAGRLIDTQEFRNLEIPLHRFYSALLDDLLDETAGTVHIEGDKLVLDHVYIERRVRPLNLYIREVNKTDAEQAILDYGQAIKDLAQTNIFPGDLLLKNFGLTRDKRVVFYDYDEVALVSECQFRKLPKPRDEDDILRPETAWHYVNNKDIFPEEFLKFLAMNAELREIFVPVHGDLLTVEYWRTIKNRHKAGEISLVIPYHRAASPANDKTKPLSTAG